MKSSFKEFLRDNIGDSPKKPEIKSIPHIEDLDIDVLLDELVRLPKLICTEKLDGAALKFGLDSSGKFYTTRAGKGDPSLNYKVEDYSLSGAGNVFKAAHAALEKNLPIIKSVLSPGEAIDIEVLFGKQPNTVMYGSNDMNYIAFLKASEGTDLNKEPDQTKPLTLADALDDVTTSVRTTMLETPDGLQLIEQPLSTSWEFIVPKRVDGTMLRDAEIQELVSGLRAYLSAENATAALLEVGNTNLDMYQISLNTLAMDMRDKAKAVREKVQNTVMDDYIIPIKNQILDVFTRKFDSKVQNYISQPKDEIGIEGVVFLDTDTEIQFKVVDKEVFREINKFNYAVRNNIRGRILTDDIYAPLKSRGGLYGNALIRIVKLFNIPGLARSNNVKKVLRKFKGTSIADTVENVTDTLVNTNFNAVKRKMIAIIDNTVEDLEDALEQFKKDYKSYKIELSNGKTMVGYSPEVTDRTLLVFAETNRDLGNLRSQIAKSKDISELVMNLFGKHIIAIHEE